MNLQDLKNRVYFSQNREDLIIESFFMSEKNGFYVDIGACHPDVASVTKKLYLKGWSGINIEPQKELHDLFVRDRGRDINLNLAVGEKEGTTILRTYINNRGMSTTEKGMKDKYKRNPLDNTSEYKDVKVEVQTLRKIFDKYVKNKKIHFLKIDVEGYEYEVIKGNDWNKYRPILICIESNHIVKNWKKMLEEAEYEKVFNDGLNDYYLDTKTKKIQFKYVENILMHLKGGIASDDYEIIKNLSEENENLISKINNRPNFFKYLIKNKK